MPRDFAPLILTVGSTRLGFRTASREMRRNISPVSRIPPLLLSPPSPAPAVSAAAVAQFTRPRRVT